MNFKKFVTKKMLLATTILSLGSSLAYGINTNNSFSTPSYPYTRHIVHYADEQNRLITLNYDTMKLLDTQELEGNINHHADPLGTLEKANYMMMVPKGSNFVTVREIKSGKHIKKIRLPFHPRSADAYNKTYNLVLLNSRNRPAAVLIDATELKIVGKAGFNITCNLMSNNYQTKMSKIYAPYDNFDSNFACLPMDFGGDQISGHPIWLNANYFVIIDRSNRLLHIYKIHKPLIKGGEWKTELRQTIYTDSSLHQLIPEDADNPNNTIFYGMTEGNEEQKIIPRIYKFNFDGNKLTKIASPQMLTHGNRTIASTTIGMLGHNLYITPDKRYLYAPLGGTRNESEWSSKVNDKGAVFVVKTSTMEVMKSIPAGTGAGHVAFSKQKHLAVVTNHMDDFVTVIDYKKHSFVKNITLNFPHKGIFDLNQSHMQHVSKDGKYYYNFWTDGGYFFRINLSNLELDAEVHTGGIPIQGNFYEKIAINTRLPLPAIEDGYDDLFPVPWSKSKIFQKESPLDSNDYNK